MKFNKPVVIFLLVAILIIVSIILYKVYENKSNFSNFSDSSSGSDLSDDSDLSLLQWNVHYECFIKNKTDCCSKPLVDYLNNRLKSVNVDFANLSMFEMVGYTPPSGYISIDGFSTKPDYECGYDITTILYNSNRWKAIGNPIYGCLSTNDRAYIIQKFVEKIRGDPKPVYVIGSHWDHPQTGENYPSASVNALNKALKDNSIKPTSRIILLADTNDNDPKHPTSDTVLMNAILGTSGTNVLGTGPNQTCCCNDKPLDSGSFPYKTDRIITSNIGKSIGTVTIPNLSDIFGSVAQCPSLLGGTCEFGEMHKPVFWKLKM
jgi:hypothetical protein